MTLQLEQYRTCAVVEVGGALRVPLKAGLRWKVHELIGRGERRILLDLSRLSAIDAAGIGELAAAFRTTAAAGGVLQIAHATRRVRRLLQLSGLWRLLTGARPHVSACGCTPQAITGSSATTRVAGL